MSGIISFAVFSLYAHNATATYIPTSDFATYTTEQISADGYNTALSQNAQAPVFKYIDSTGATGYYKWIMPDLSVYKDKDGNSVYSLEEPLHSSTGIEFLVVDSEGNVSAETFYYNSTPAQGYPNKVTGEPISGTYIGNNNKSSLSGWSEAITANFINNYQNTTMYGGEVNSGIALNITNSTKSIQGNFINNRITGFTGMGAALFVSGSYYNTPVIVDVIEGNFIKNKTFHGGAVYNGGTINELNGSFIQNETVYEAGRSNYGGAIANNGTIKKLNADFICNTAIYDAASTEGKGGAIYNSQNGMIESLYGNFIGNVASKSQRGGAIWNAGTITMGIADKAPMVFATETDTIHNEGTLNFAAGTIYLQSVYDADTAIGTMNVNGADVIFADGATLTQKNINVNSGTLAISASGLKSNVTNNSNGTVSLLGGSLDVDITGGGKILIDGDVISNTNIVQDTTITTDNKLSVSGSNLSANVVNNGVLELTGGSISYPYTISGTGITNIVGNVTSSRNISQNVNVLDGASLSASTASYLGGVVTNDGMLTLGAGTLKFNVLGTGTTYINNSVESLAKIDNDTIINQSGRLDISADNLSDSVTNNGKLYLNSGTLSTGIAGTGSTHITGTVNNGTKWAGKTLIIEDNGHLISSANDIENGLLNYGVLTLNGGTLNYGVGCDGTTIIDGSVRAETNNAISNNLQVKQDSVLIANATILNGANIENQGTLRLTSGQLSSVVSGTGTTEISGTVSATAKINQGITIGEDAGLYISASNIGSKVQNAGSLTLNAGTLTQDVSGAGQTVISGNVHNNATINQTVIINSASDTLTTAFDKLAGAITNRGNLVLTSGTIDKYIGGNGTISIAGNITNTAAIDHKIDITSAGILTSDADKLRKTVNNNGKLYLDSGKLSNGITGTNGKLYVRGDVTTGGTISQKSVEVLADGILNTQASHLGTDITNNGTVNIFLGNLSKGISGSGVTNILGDVSISKNKLGLGDVSVAEVGALNLHGYELTTQDLTLDGTLLLEINNVSKDSSDYTGGHLIVDGNLTYGDNSKLQLLVGSGLSQRQHTGELELITVNGQASGSFSEIVANNLYSVEQRNGKYIISYGPTINDVVEIGGGNDNNKATANAWDRIENPTGLTKELQSVLNYLLQYDEENYVKGLDNLAPSDSNFVAGIARTTNTTMAQQIAKRLSDVRGRSGGDVTFKDMSVWAQGLYNMAEQDGDATFNSKTFGVMAGIDGNITDNLTVGVGYAYNKTNADADEREVKANGSTVSLYGEYVHNFDRTIDKEKGLDEVYKNKQYLEGVYVNAAISYGSTDYEEESEMGNFADYTVSSIGANANVGLALTGTKFVPEVGVRYLHINKYDYQDAAEQEINVDAADILTLVANAKYSTSFDVNMLTSEQNTRSLSLKPFGHIGVSYDVLNSDNVANVSIANVQYQIQGESIDPLGVSAGLGIETSFWGFDWQFGYDLEWHSNFTSHTGKIRAKYVF